MSGCGRHKADARFLRRGQLAVRQRRKVPQRLLGRTAAQPDAGAVPGKGAVRLAVGCIGGVKRCRKHIVVARTAAAKVH